MLKAEKVKIWPSDKVKNEEVTVQVDEHIQYRYETNDTVSGLET